MKKWMVLWLGLFVFASCDTAKDIAKALIKANVVMIEGPIFEDGDTNFYYKGRVQNKGTAGAISCRVHIYIRNSAGTLLAQNYNSTYESTLSPNETSGWHVLFTDDGRKIRDALDPSKMTYEIKWD